MAEEQKPLKITTHNGTIRVLSINDVLGAMAAGEMLRSFGNVFDYVATVAPESYETSNSSHSPIEAEYDKDRCVKIMGAYSDDWTMDCDVRASMDEVVLLDEKAKNYLARVHPDFYAEMRLIKLR